MYVCLAGCFVTVVSAALREKGNTSACYLLCLDCMPTVGCHNLHAELSPCTRCMSQGLVCRAVTPLGSPVGVKIMPEDSHELAVLLSARSNPSLAAVPILHVAHGYDYSAGSGAEGLSSGTGGGDATSGVDVGGCFLSAVVMPWLPTLTTWMEVRVPVWPDQNDSFRAFEGMVCALVKVSSSTSSQLPGQRL